MTTLKWNKMGLLFEPNKFNVGDWMHEFAQAPCTLEFNDFIRVYFSCRSKPNEKNQYTSYAAYVDLCKNNLFKEQLPSSKTPHNCFKPKSVILFYEKFNSTKFLFWPK